MYHSFIVRLGSHGLVSIDSVDVPTLTTALLSVDARVSGRASPEVRSFYLPTYVATRLAAWPRYRQAESAGREADPMSTGKDAKASRGERHSAANCALADHRCNG